VSVATGELDTLLAARAGDHAAGRALVVAHGPAMKRTAWSVLGRYGSTAADDVVQEALVAALTTSALPRGDVGAWLRSITARKALDWLRQLRQRREDPLPEAGAVTEPAAQDRVERVLDVLSLRRALATLSATDRAVLVLADVEGLSMAEVSQALGLTQIAVRLRASRARRKLRGLLDKVPPRAGTSGESRENADAQER